MRKISLIGAGNIGTILAYSLSRKKIGQIALIDVVDGLAEGKCLDLAQSFPVDNINGKIEGTTDISKIKDSAAIIITAGVARKPGMSRDDLLGINLKIIKQVAQGVKNNSPNAFVICITNPLDVIVMAFQKYSGLPTNKVVGMAGILDSSRYKYFLSKELKEPVKNIEAFVLGGHGDTMVPMLNYTLINKKPLSDLIKSKKISKEKVDEIINKTRKGGAEIVKLLEKGSAFYAPAASGVEMAESYLKNLKKTLPCAAYLKGEYGFKDLYAGVPVVIGAKGVEKVLEIKLDTNEKKNFEISINAVKELFESALKLDADLK